jgi:acyl-CoA reductase-like NAD-dependent aldehyde dehydrogenase
MRYAQPGQPGSVVPVSPRYENFIDGKWVSPALGQYMTNLAPATAKPICEVAKSTDRGRHRLAPRDARGRRELGERQAGA